MVYIIPFSCRGIVVTGDAIIKRSPASALHQNMPILFHLWNYSTSLPLGGTSLNLRTLICPIYSESIQLSSMEKQSTSSYPLE